MKKLLRNNENEFNTFNSHPIDTIKRHFVNIYIIAAAS